MIRITVNPSSSKRKGAIPGLVTLVIVIVPMIMILIVSTKIIIEHDVAVEINQEMETRTQDFNTEAALYHISNQDNNTEKLIKYGRNDLGKSETRQALEESIYFNTGTYTPSSYVVEARFPGKENIKIAEDGARARFTSITNIASPKKKPANLTVRMYN